MVVEGWARVVVGGTIVLVMGVATVVLVGRFCW